MMKSWKVKSYLDWLLKQTWPLPMIPMAFGFYFVLQAAFAGNGAQVNIWYGTCLQVLGGIQILWSIDKNLREFNKKNIWASFLAWFRARPRTGPVSARMVTVLDEVSVTSTASLKAHRNFNTIAERVQYLEAEVSSLREELANAKRDIRSRTDELKKAIGAAIADGKKQVAEIRLLVQDIAVGDIKAEVTGLAVVIMGTIFAAMG